MAMSVDNPLTREHCDCCNKCLQNAAKIAAYLAKVKAAGIPTEAAEEENEHIASLARGIKREFFPHEP